MSGVRKVFVFVIACVLIKDSSSKPHLKRHHRSEHPPNGYFIEYQQPSNYQSVPTYQPYQQSYYAMPPQMPFPGPQPYPAYPYYMPYNYYPPMYPPYPMYQPYPYYQPYSYPPPPQNYYPDPYAHIPTEIVDIDSDESVNYRKKGVEIESSHKADAIGANQPIQSTNVVTSKPVQTVITRTFDSNNSEAAVKIVSSDPEVVKVESAVSDKNGDPEINDKKESS